MMPTAPADSVVNYIVGALSSLFTPGQVTELRALDVSTRDYRRPHTVSGYFDDLHKLAIEAASLSPKAKGVYIVPNPVNPALLARSVNRARAIDRESTTSDNDIVKRHWLLIDADPTRPSDISSSEDEHEAALNKAREIRDVLRAEGWPEPIFADSGNGAHLMYRVDLPRDDGDLIKKVLAALAFRFDDKAVTIDQKVFNPARIWKLYGTQARKGDNTSERPHRYGKLLESPTLAIVPTTLLEQLAASMPVIEPSYSTRQQHKGEPFDIEKFISDHNLGVIGPFNWQNGRKWIFRICPWNSEHRNRSAWLIQYPSGAIAAGCQHNGCAGNDWHSLRDQNDPGWRERKQSSQQSNGHSNERTDPSAPDPLDDARAQLGEFQERIKQSPSEALCNALESISTIGALALVANHDRRAYEAMLMRLREAKLKQRDINALDRSVMERRKQERTLHAVQPNEDSGLAAVKFFLPTAPTSNDIVVPAGWRLSEAGLIKESNVAGDNGTERVSLTPVAPTPILITGRLKDVTDNSESTRLAWLRDGRWQQHPTPRSLVANSRSIVELAGMGLPVTSLTAGGLVEYLASFEAANIQQLPRANVSKQMGWLGEGGRLGFLWGRTLVRADGMQVTADIDALSPDQWNEGVVSFRGEDAGDEQIADGYYAAGSFEGWKAAVKPVSRFPRVAIMLYGALATPLLSVLEVPNFTIDLAYQTSTGKTTTLRVAGSCWGNPDERAPASTVGTWDATRVWIERASAILNGLPLILDDTKRAKNPKTVAQVIYDVSSGKGRGRGSPKGMRRAGTWCTILLSTGEAQATSFTEDGGTRGRVLSLWGKPFDHTNRATAQMVHGIDAAVRQHFGHAGPRMVEFIMQHRAEWDDWRNEYREVQAGYVKKASGDPVASRYAAYFAVLDMTAALAHAALDLPWDYRDPLAALWEELLAGARDADRPTVALEYVQSWAQGHQSEFWMRHATDIQTGAVRVPSSGWAGRWDDKDDWGFIAFLPDRLQSILISAGYEVKPVLRIWRERGWMLSDENRETYSTKISKVTARTIAIQRSAFVALDSGQAIPPDNTDEEES